MKPRQAQSAADRNTASSRQHKLHPSVTSLPFASSSLSMQSCEDEPPPAPALTVTAAEKLEWLLAELDNGAKEGKGKSGANNFSVIHKSRKQDLASRPVEEAECLLNVSGAARFLAVSVSTLYGWVWQRRISFVKLGRAVRFDMADLKRFVEQNRIHGRTARKV